MYRFLGVVSLCSMFLASNLVASSISSEEKKESKPRISIPSHKLLVKKIRRRKNRHRYGQQPTTYNVYYSLVDYDNYLCKLVSRESYLTFKALTVEGTYCEVNMEALASHNFPLTKPEDVSSYFASGEKIPASLADKCIVCEDQQSEYANPNCGHLCLCKACSLRLHQCPLCRSHAQKFIKIYRR